jgi:hypothetical protein
MNYVVYYHIFASSLGCAIAREQLVKITRLLPDPQIRCGIVKADLECARELLDHLRSIKNLEVIAEAGEGNEWLTLLPMHAECLHRWPADLPVLYLHTKGAFSAHKHIPLWREWMEYFVLFRHRDALRVLREGYTAYGFDAWFNLRRKLLRGLGFRPRFFIYSGNYWWTTAGAVRRISLKDTDMTGRHSAEADFLPRVPGIRPFEALQLIGLPSISGGAYTNYNDDFRHFEKLAERSRALDEMRAALNS